jgi:hypothetical protein
MTDLPSHSTKTKKIFMCIKEEGIDITINKQIEGHGISKIEEKINLDVPKRIRFKLKERKIKQGRWTDEEHERFLRACYEHPNNWQKVKLSNLDRGEYENEKYCPNKIACPEIFNKNLQIVRY